MGLKVCPKLKKWSHGEHALSCVSFRNVTFYITQFRIGQGLGVYGIQGSYKLGIYGILMLKFGYSVYLLFCLQLILDIKYTSSLSILGILHGENFPKVFWVPFFFGYIGVPKLPSSLLPSPPRRPFSTILRGLLIR